MNIIYVTLLTLLASLSLASCDPAKILVVKADKDKSASVIVYANNRIAPYTDRNDSAKLIIQVPQPDTMRKTFHYGIGGWSNEAIAEMANNIDSIVFLHPARKSTLTSKHEITQYLRNGRSGFGGRILTIEAK